MNEALSLLLAVLFVYGCYVAASVVMDVWGYLCDALLNRQNDRRR